MIEIESANDFVRITRDIGTLSERCWIMPVEVAEQLRQELNNWWHERESEKGEVGK